MSQQRTIDTVVGIFMLAGLAALTLMAFKVSNFRGFSGQDTYQVSAEFTDIGGLRIRAPVTIAGVKIGEVTRIDLQSGALNAKVTMRLQSGKPIPYEDISARILTQGLLGSNYISIIPGFDAAQSQHPYLREGDTIEKTQEAIILENLIGQLLFNLKK